MYYTHEYSNEIFEDYADCKEDLIINMDICDYAEHVCFEEILRKFFRRKSSDEFCAWLENLVHIASVKDGAIVHFPHSAYEYMKVCDKNGIGGVVRFLHGEYINTRDLEAEGLGVMCEIAYDNLDRMYYSDDEEDIDDAGIAMRESLGNNWW